VETIFTTICAKWKRQQSKVLQVGGINGFPFFKFFLLLLVEVILEGDSWKYYSVCISAEVAICIVSNFLFFFFSFLKAVSKHF